MASRSLSRSGLVSAPKYASLLVGNDAFSPSSFDLISSTILTSTASTVTFSSIPNNYKHLQIRYVARNDRAFAFDTFMLRFNGVSTNSYIVHDLYGNGSSVTSSAAGGSSAQSQMQLTTWLPTAQSAANAFYGGIVDILDYGSTTKNTTVRMLGGKHDASSYNDVRLNSGAWFNTSAVSSITLFAGSSNLVSGSRFSLYGIKG